MNLTRYSTGNCESRSCSLLLNLGGKILRNFFNKSTLSPVTHDTANIGQMRFSTNIFAALTRSSSFSRTYGSCFIEGFPCFNKYVRHPIVCWILVLEHRSILLITTRTGTSNVIAYEKCSRVVSTKEEKIRDDGIGEKIKGTYRHSMEHQRITWRNQLHRKRDQRWLFSCILYDQQDQ